MKVVGLVPSPSAISIVFIDDGSGGVQLKFRDEWHVGEDRFAGYCTLRSRLVENLTQWGPDAVVITAFEPYSLKSGTANASWFRTAEVRGVLSEAARSVVQDTKHVLKATITKTIGERKADKYLKDDTFWTNQFGPDFPKKYREAALLALTCIRRK